MNPFVSIVTINYNNKTGLRDTVQSVVEQSYSNYEFLIIDGGSTDGSTDVIQKNKEKFSHWVSEKDQGIFNAQNKGIEASKGEYLLFLNSGDLLNGPSALEDFISHKDFGGDIIYGDYKFDEGQKIYPDQLTPYYFMRTSLPHQSTLFKRTVFESEGLYDEKYRMAADRAFYLKCFLTGKYKFRHIKYFLTIFDLSGISNDPKFLEKKRSEDEAIFKEYYGVYYDDMVALRDIEKALSQAKRDSLPGILKLIKNRLTR